MQPIIIKRHRVQLASENAARTTPQPAVHKSAHAPSKKVELLEQDGEVRALEFKCACGEKTVIEIQYPPANNEKGSR